MFKKVLIANRGEIAAGVSAKPNCAVGAAQQRD
jgi:acetyl/propionyl-CoA carboxylase alpha subunit